MPDDNDTNEYKACGIFARKEMSTVTPFPLTITCLFSRVVSFDITSVATGSVDLKLKISYHILPLPSCRFDVLNSLSWMGFLRVFVSAHKWIRVLALLQISQCVIDLPMLRLVCTNV